MTKDNSPVIITLEDLEYKLSNYKTYYKDRLCQDIIEHMLDYKGPLTIVREEGFGSDWFYLASRDVTDKLWREHERQTGVPKLEATKLAKEIVAVYYQHLLFDMIIAAQDYMASDKIQSRIARIPHTRQQHSVLKLAFEDGCRNYIQSLPLKMLTNLIPFAELFKYTSIEDLPNIILAFNEMDSNAPGCLLRVQDKLNFGDKAVDQVINRFFENARIKFANGELKVDKQTVVFK